MKICPKCNIEKSLEFFNKSGYCKECISLYNKKYRENNKNKIIDYKKKYYQDNKIKLKNIYKKYREDNKEYYKKYNRDYREKTKNIILIIVLSII